MPALKQGKVNLTIQTPLGRDEVIISQFQASERISETYEFTAIIVVDKNNVDMTSLIGQPATIAVEFLPDETDQKVKQENLNKASKVLGLFNAGNLRKKLGLGSLMTIQSTNLILDQYPGILTFLDMNKIKGTLGGLSKKLGSALGKLSGGDKNSLSSGGSASGSKGGFAKNLMAKLSSSLGGSSENGLPAGLMGKLGSGLSGALGGDQGGKQGTGVGENKTGGGGITNFLLQKASGLVGGGENPDHVKGLLTGLSTKIMGKLGVNEDLQAKVHGLINKIDSEKVTTFLKGKIEGDENQKGLINIAKEKILGIFQKKNQHLDSIQTIAATASAADPGPKERRAFGETVFPQTGMVQRDLSRKIRYFHGIIGEISQGPTDSTDASLTVYIIKLYPKLWLLKHSKNCRIFQKMTAMEIISTILNENNVTDVTNKTQKAGQIVRDYCVQYNESHFDFISRLMEFEGIYYYFIHTEDTHYMVLADDPQAHHQCPHLKKAIIETARGEVSNYNAIQEAELVSSVVPGEYALTDYDFQLPRNKLFSKVSGKGYGGRIYEYPGDYNNKSDGEDLTRLRIEAGEIPREMLYGMSTIPYFETGAYFELSGHIRDDANKKYVLLQLDHFANQEEDLENETLYSNKFSAFDYEDGPYRPKQKTPCPKIIGTQTARVTGKEGEEIWTDQYGRVKVKFHWDESSDEDENTSCWIRVAQGWAGNNWGILFTPRVGHEVVVSFLNGDPDQPLITGSVYNGEKLPPYLPDQPTMSTVKTNSSKDSSGYNELRFQDLADEEEIYLRAEKDMNTDILNNRSETIHRGNYTQTIKTGSRTVTLEGEDASKTDRAVSQDITGTGDDTLILNKGSRFEHLQAQGEKPGDYTTTLDRGNRTVTLKQGDEIITLEKGNRTINVNEGDETRDIKGMFKQTVSKDYTLTIAGNLDIQVTGDIKINGRNITLETKAEEKEEGEKEGGEEKGGKKKGLAGLGGKAKKFIATAKKAAGTVEKYSKKIDELSGKAGKFSKQFKAVAQKGQMLADKLKVAAEKADALKKQYGPMLKKGANMLGMGEKSDSSKKVAFGKSDTGGNFTGSKGKGFLKNIMDQGKKIDKQKALEKGKALASNVVSLFKNAKSKKGGAFTGSGGKNFLSSLSGKKNQGKPGELMNMTKMLTGKKDDKKGGMMSSLMGNDSKKDDKKSNAGPAGVITLISTKVDGQAQESIALKAKDISATAAMTMTMEGATSNTVKSSGMANVTSGGITKITGSVVKIN